MSGTHPGRWRLLAIVLALGVAFQGLADDGPDAEVRAPEAEQIAAAAAPDKKPALDTLPAVQPVRVITPKGVVAGQTLNAFNLPPGGSIVIEFDVTVDNPVSANTAFVQTQGNVNPGVGGNFTAFSTVDPDAAPDPDLSDATATLIDAEPDLALAKSDGGVTVTPGDTITYTLTATNNGDEDAADVELSETVPANATFNAGASSPGWLCLPDATAGSTCTLAVGTLAGGGGSTMATFAVDVADPVPAGVSQIDNSATVNASNAPAPAGAMDSTPVNATPVLAATKAVADASSDGVAQAGEVLTYTITVTDSGDEGAASVQIDDAAPAGTTYDDGQAVITGQSGATNAQITNDAGTLQVTVDELAGGGGFVTVTFQVIVDASGLPTTISNEAQVQASGISQFNSTTAVVGVEIDYGDAPDSPYPTLLANDGARHAGSGAALRLGTLWDAEAEGQPDASATGDDLAGSDDEDGVTVPVLGVGRASSVSVEVAGSGGLLNAWIDYDQDGVWESPDEQIASDLAMAAGSNTVNFTVPATASTGSTFARFRLDSGGGLTPTGFAGDGEVEDYRVQIESPAITVTKTASPTTVGEPGGTVTFTVRVDNAGTAAIDLASLTDDLHGNLDGQGDCAVPQTIAIAGFYECSFTATVTGNAGDSETDTVTAAGTGAGIPVMASDDATVTITDVVPTITVTKTADPTAVAEPGGTVTFTVRIDNTGADESVTLTALADDVHGDLDGQGDCTVPQTIAAGSFYECSFTATVAGNAGDSETDTVTATAADDDSNTVMASDSATVTVTDVAPTIAVTKTADPTTVVEPGGTVTFTVRVDNTGTVEPVTLTALDDDVHGDLDGQGDCTVPQTIAAGSFYECSFTATVSGNAGDSETDTVTATATDDDSNTAMASDSATVTITDVAPTITVTKTADPTTVVEPGGTVTFTVRVDNTGTVEPVTLTALADDVHGDLDGQGDCAVPQSIAAGSFYECSFTATVTGSAGDSETDTVTAKAEDDDGNTVTAQDSATVDIVSPDDDVPPTVTAVTTLAGPLADCDVVRQRIRSLRVGFQDDASDVEGAGDAANYLLVGSGPDGDFSTADCSGPSGDDVEIAIVALSLVSADPLAPSATLDFGASLAPGLYRLLVCDAIADAAGNALDGDGDGNAGGNFELGFRADPLNLFENGHFDDCPVTLAPWTTVVVPPNDVQPANPGTDDSEGSPLSASARVFHTTGDLSALRQCVAVRPRLAHDLRAEVRFNPVAPALSRLEVSCKFFATADCTGVELGEILRIGLLKDEVDVWIAVDAALASPAGAGSARCAFRVEAIGAGTNFSVFLDQLFLTDHGVIFTDGFESGDVSAWSSRVP